MLGRLVAEILPHAPLISIQEEYLWADGAPWAYNWSIFSVEPHGQALFIRDAADYQSDGRLNCDLSITA